MSVSPFGICSVIGLVPAHPIYHIPMQTTTFKILDNPKYRTICGILSWHVLLIIGHQLKRRIIVRLSLGELSKLHCEAKTLYWAKALLQVTYEFIDHVIDSDGSHWCVHFVCSPNQVCCPMSCHQLCSFPTFTLNPSAFVRASLSHHAICTRAQSVYLNISGSFVTGGRHRFCNSHIFIYFIPKV